MILGADPSSKRLALASSPTDWQLIEYATPTDTAERLEEIVRAIEDYTIPSPAGPLGIAEWGVEAILTEQPSGKYTNPILSYAVGVTVLTLRRLTGAPTWLVTSQQWKVACGLPGNASKPAIAARARELGWNGDGPQDVADAVCLQHAAETLIVTEAAA